MRTTTKKPIKEYKVDFFDGKESLGTRTLQVSKQQLWKKLKLWLEVARDRGREKPRFEITEVYHEKPLTTLFLDKDKREQISGLLKSAKELLKSYDKDSVKFARARRMALCMWNEVQNEFYMSTKICDNTVWKWQDCIAEFDRTGYLFDNEPCELTEWTKFLTGLYIRQWAVEILNIVKDWNLDNQDPVYVKNFQHDFMRAKNKEEFYSALLKWTDLIYWSPWKMKFMENSVPQPLNMHWEDDYNEDLENNMIAEGGI